MHRLSFGSLVLLGLTTAIVPAAAQELSFRTTANNYGGAGLIDMPVATPLPDGEFLVNIARSGPSLHTALTFQMTPRLQGTFRYSGAMGLDRDPAGFSVSAGQYYFDRSFDVRFQLLREGRYLPDVTVGLQDFVGTGLYSGEYIVATKSIHPRVKVTAGLGWGRLGGQARVANPGQGGLPAYDRWFRGPAAAFGGVEWQVTDRLGLKLEYSSDRYLEERGLTQFTANNPLDYRSPLNVGLEYQLGPGYRVGAYYKHGSTVGVSFTLFNNPSRPRLRGVQGAAPIPVPLRSDPRTRPQDFATDWADSREVKESLRDTLAEHLKGDGLILEALVLTGTRAELRIRNPGIDANAQAIGRAARAMAIRLPMSVEHFDIVPVTRGIPASMVRLRRSDLERLETAPDAAAQLRARAEFLPAGALASDALRGKDLYPKLTWAAAPYLEFQLFDPRTPIQPEAGLRLRAAYDVMPGVKIYGSAKYRLLGGLENFTPLPLSASKAPFKVRSEAYKYEKNAFAIENLAVSWQGRVANDIYGRVSLGYLERHFAGVSGEVLWKPVNSRLALGAELNYVQQRAFDTVLGLQGNPFVTGHVSAYYEFRNGLLAQVDVGRYLGRDIGATVTLEREFANGWRAGVFATLTDMPFSTFGEGSFDKGVKLTIPFSWMLGTPSRADVAMTLRPVQRDGGARLVVEDRLYMPIREYHAKRLDDQWGRVWR